MNEKYNGKSLWKECQYLLSGKYQIYEGKWEKVREGFSLKMNAIWMPIQLKLWKQRISLNSKASATVVQRRKNALFWLVAVPEQFGIVLIKSPRAKGNFDLFVLLQDSSFCVEKLDTDLLCLKQKYSDGYNEEIQMYMGL